MIKSETTTTNVYYVLHIMALKVSVLTRTELHQIRNSRNCLGQHIDK